VEKELKAEEPPLTRYQMMALLVDSEPLAADEFAAVLARHCRFVAGGGGGGRWETFVTPVCQGGDHVALLEPSTG